MANITWNGASDTTWGDADNWVGGAEPGVNDIAVFDGAVANVNCTLDASTSVSGVQVVGGGSPYSGTIDLANSAYTLTIEGDGLVCDGSGTFDCGNATIAIDDGPLDNKDQSGWVPGTSTITLDGDCTITGSYLNDFYDLVFASGSVITLAAASNFGIEILNSVAINGALTLNDYFNCKSDCTITFGVGADFKSASTHRIDLGTSNSGKGITSIASGAVIDGEINVVRPNSGAVLAPHPEGFGGLVRLINSSSALNGTLEFTAGGAYIFNGGLEIENGGTKTMKLDCTAAGISITTTDLILDNNNADGTVVITNSGATTDWTITGDVIDEITAGTLTWTRGTGTITASGAASQDWDWVGVTVEDVDVDKSGGELTFSGPVTMTSFLGTAGAFDPNGQTIETTGNFITLAGFQTTNAADVMNGCTIIVGGNPDLNGQSGTLLRLLATASWTFTVNGSSAHADFVEVQHSNAGDGIEIIAPPSCVNGDNNINWSFCHPMYAYAQQAA